MTHAAQPGTRRHAPRYAVEAPVRLFVASGEEVEGTTVNISRLGMLIRAAGPARPPLSTQARFRLALSPGRGWSGACVDGVGRILRWSRADTDSPLIAVTIDQSFLRPAECLRAHPFVTQITEGAALVRVLTGDEHDPEAISGESGAEEG